MAEQTGDSILCRLARKPIKMQLWVVLQQRRGRPPSDHQASDAVELSIRAPILALTLVWVPTTGWKTGNIDFFLLACKFGRTNGRFNTLLTCAKTNQDATLGCPSAAPRASTSPAPIIKPPTRSSCQYVLPFLRSFWFGYQQLAGKPGTLIFFFWPVSLAEQTGDSILC